jgi:hypothetical protein
MMGIDRYLLNLADKHMSSIDDSDDFKEQVIEAIKNGEKINYGSRKQFTIDPADSDLYDKVVMTQKQMMVAYVKGDDKELLRLIKAACSMEIDSMTDLIGD